MSQTIRRAVALAGLTAALLFAIPAPSHAAPLRGAVLEGPASATGLMTRAWSWLEGVLGVSAALAATHQRPAAFQKDIVMQPITLPPTGVSGSGSMIDPDGKN